jgi:dipeptidyl aminopeptidase/acylaminoacyl peptidase
LALDDKEKRMDSIRDLESLHAFVVANGLADAHRIALMGGSYGGYMTLAGLAFQPQLWAAGIDTVGMSNLVTFLQRTASWRRRLREQEYGSLDTDRELLESLSPLHAIDAIRAPLFVIHGANDPRVPLAEAEQIVEALHQRGRIAELLVYADEGHGLHKFVNRMDAYTRVTAFCEQYVRGAKES